MRVTASVRGVAGVLGCTLVVAMGVASGAVGQGEAEGGATARNGDPAPAAGAGVRGDAKVSRELVGLRSADSRTYALDDGRMLTKVFASPVNFRAGGDWRAIDTRLESDGGGSYGIASAGFDLSLPATLDGQSAVRVARGPHALRFSLDDVQPAAATVDGARVTYPSVRPGLDLQYVARPDGVKESLLLDDPAAAERLDFSLDTGGLTPKLTPAGGIQVADGDGRVAFGIAAPFMRDASGAVSRDVTYEIAERGQGWTLSVRPSRAWLGDPARRFPVEVDPTIYIGEQADCHIDSGTPSTSLCGDDELEVGWSGSEDHRALLKFDVGAAIPKGGLIEEGYVALYLQGRSTTTNKPLSVYRATTAWTDQASWNSADGATAWTTAGGDFDSTRAWRTNWMGGYSIGQYQYWSIGELIQKWVDGAVANHGVVIKDENGTSHSNVLRFASSEHWDTERRPYLGVTWSPRTGMERQFTFVEQKLSDRLGLAVNVANGNLVQRSDDMKIAGTGLDLNVSRYFNNRAKNPVTTSGRKTQLSVGGGVMLLERNSDDRMLIGKTGSRHVFRANPDGSFTAPTAIDAKLAAAGGGHTLTFNQTKEVHRFDADGNLTAMEDRNGNAISFDYSGWGVVEDITDTQGRVVDADYNGAGLLESLEDWAGRTWHYDYDGYDRLTDYTDPDGGVTEYFYQGPDNLIEVEDPRGVVTRMTYDGDSRVTEIKRDYDRSNGSYKSKTSFAYSAPTAPCGTGDIGKTVMTDPRGKTTTYCYDVELRVTKAVDANGNARSATYTGNSDVLSATAPGSAQTSFGYDSLNNLTDATEPQGEESTLEYNASGHPYLPSKSTSPQGTSTMFAYDTAGNTTSVADGGSPGSQVQASLEYNGQAGGQCPNDPTTKPGTLRCAIDGNQNRTLYGYDDAGNLTSITPELPLGDTTITYDSLSRVKTVEDGKGQVRTYSYDALDRVTEIDYPGGSSVTFDYDANGNRTERIDSQHGTTAWDYDDMNRQVEEDLPEGTLSYTWDAASNLKSFTDPGGTVNYGYDDVNRLTELAEPGGSCASPASLCTTFGYTTRDRRNRTTYPNGVEQTVTYDSSDKPTRIRAVKGATVLTDFSYVYDDQSSPVRNTRLRQSVTDKDGNKIAYGYDTLDRLTSAIERNSSNAVIDSRTYTYDKASNRMTYTLNGNVMSYAYNDANQLCWRYPGSSSAGCASPPTGAKTYTFDANGNLTGNSDGMDLDYNVRDHTIGWVALPGADFVAHEYAGPGQTERTSMDGRPELNSLLGLSRQGTVSWTRDSGGDLVSRRSGSQRHYYLTDALGSVRALTDASGAVVKTYKYDAYGQLTAGTGTLSDPFQWAGEYRHTAANLTKIGVRYYQSALGRWSQLDPLDQAGDLRDGNRYVYAGADPVNIVDPTGMFSLDINVSAGPVEAGVDISKDGKVTPYVGAGGGVGGGASVNASFGKNKDGPTGGGCAGACLGFSQTGGSVGVGPKASAGIYYRKYLR